MALLISSVFAGRRAELELLRGVRAPAVVFVEADAGGGKTRLVGEFLRGRDGLVGGCLESGLPYAPFTAILRGIGAAEVRRLLPGGAADDLARLLPALGEPSQDGGTGKVRLFERFLTLLDGLGPVVLVVEDAHWADRSTLELLTFLVRNRAPVVLVVTYRTGAGTALRALVAESARLEHVTRLVLPPLRRAEVREQLDGLGVADPAVLRRAHELSGGNPLFVEAVAAGGAGLDSLRDLLLAGVRELPEGSREVVRTACAGGAVVGHALLGAVTGLAETGLLASVRPAVEQGILVAAGNGYAFRHALIREAVHDELLPHESRLLHLRYAEAITADPGLSENPGIDLAEHWAAAGEVEAAFTTALRAAEECVWAAAYPEGFTQFLRVLDLWHRVEDPADKLGRSRAALLAEAAWTASTAAEYVRGEECVTEALALTRDPERRATLLFCRAVLRGYTSPEESLSDLLAAERESAAPTVHRARLLGRLSTLLLTFGDLEASGRYAAEGLEIARSAGDAECGDDLSVTVAAAVARTGDLTALEKLTERGFEGARLVALRNHLAHGYLSAGRDADAERVAVEGVAAAERAGLARAIGLPAAVNLAEALFWQGRWDEADARLDRTLDLVDGLALRVQVAIWKGELFLARGGPRPDPALLEAPYESGPPQTVVPLAGLAIEFALADGDPGRGRAVLDRVARNPGLVREPSHAWPFLVKAARIADVSEIVSRVGVVTELDAAHAAVLAADWPRAIAAWERIGRPLPLARTLFHAGCADLAAGARSAAAQRFDRAAAIAADLGARPLAEAIAARTRRSGTGLTAREQDVLALLALGRSNRQIADELVISVKTASVHVSNILAKLGVASRGEAAAIARDLR